MSMLHHLSFAVADLGRSSAFYDAALSPLGYARVWSDERAVGYDLPSGDDEFAIKLNPAGAAIPGEGFHVYLAAPLREAVIAFYKAALEHGGNDNGGAGLHPEYGRDYYTAFTSIPMATAPRRSPLALRISAHTDVAR